MKKLLPILIGLSLSGFSLLNRAENLMRVYRQARLGNPESRKSAADRDAAFERISEVRNSLLPQLGLGADYAYSNGYRDVNGINSNATSTSSQLTRSTFGMLKWRTLALREKAAGIQDVTYQTDRQALVLNTAIAHFDVSDVIDVLSYAQTQKEAIYRQLDQTTQRFNVGLIAVTDVQNVRAQYGTVLANEITTRNNLNNMVEQLRQIAGSYHPELAAPNVENFKADRLQPVNALLKEVERRSPSLLQTRLSQDLAREQICQAQGGHLPTLDLAVSAGIPDASYSGSKTRGATGTQYDDSNMGQNKVGLSFSPPIYQDGVVNSQVKQAQYNSVGASGQLGNAHRNVVQTACPSFNNTNVSISSINAYKRAVVSAQSSLDAMEAGYSAGARTIVGVSDTTTTLYNTKQELANTCYNYPINQLNIRSVLGTLNEQDLLALNNALSKPVSTNPGDVAPQAPEQNAIADGYTPDSPASVVQ